jgi:nucleotide-binding universal stress UspA family protein
VGNSILVSLDDSMCSRKVVDYMARLCVRRESTLITLLHIFREPQAGEGFMGKKFMEERRERIQEVLDNARRTLVENGFDTENITSKIITEDYPTVTDGIIDQFKKGDYDMVVIGRKRMSKAEEFVMGDISIKLVRALEGTAILVVKPS